MKELILQQDRMVPRYTSYPTAPHFLSGFEAGAYKNWLSALPNGQSISLYIHTPFCPKLCWFCGCHTKITHSQAPVLEYVDYLRSEIDMLAACVPADIDVQNIHFGGGSPTIISPMCFDALMENIRTKFTVRADAEISVEIDPRSITNELMTTYATCGVNRLSFGVQDFDEKVMTAVNRPQPFDAVNNAIFSARNHGIQDINIDLMYGLPYQTMDTMKALSEKALLLNPTRISLFGYAHVPWMKKHMRLIPDDTLPDMNLRYDLFENLSATFEKSGYIAIGIDHFAKENDSLACAAKKGALRRNFQGYTTDTCDVLLGIGASAISKLPQGFVQNTVHMPQYRDRIKAGFLPVEKHCAISTDDAFYGDIIEQLMCTMRVDLDAVCQKHNRPISILEPCLKKMDVLLKLKLAHLEDGKIITVSHRFVVRLVCAAFDAYIKTSPSDVPRHATAI